MDQDDVGNIRTASIPRCGARSSTPSCGPPPAPDQALADEDRLIVLATPAGLRRVRVLSAGTAAAHGDTHPVGDTGT
ncbi:hypothetical protein ACVGVM_27490 [Pseudonocardia bannensis]|uniref:Uncharacterized protein n=1 Tax=Pseudonocardia bannensis TaxID=630973 RepID=A0A848DFB0_9PSEU|nr:hypothetical protein [Pseudonocardia bannensis]NMH91322.1 hypothetical protein [Pseudonocardia bannensis]